MYDKRHFMFVWELSGENQIKLDFLLKKIYSINRKSMKLAASKPVVSCQLTFQEVTVNWQPTSPWMPRC